MVAHRAWEQLGGREPYLRRARGDLDRPDDGGGGRAAPSSSTRTRGTRTSAATSRSSCTGSRTSRPCTRSSRCGRGRPSSSAAATRVSSWCERSALEAADAVIAVSAEHRRDLLALLPARRPGARDGDRERDRHRGVPPRPGTDVLERYGIDPAGRRSSSSAGSRGRRASPTFSTRRSQIDPAAQLVLSPGAPDTPEIAAEIAGEDRARCRRARGERRLGRADAAEARGDPDPLARHRLRLPVDLRAARHRQPRGDGLRGGRRRDRDRRHPGGRRGRRHGPARAVRPGRRPVTRAARPGQVRPRHRRARRTGCSTTRPKRGGWARPAVNARSPSSAGRPLPSASTRSTERCSEPPSLVESAGRVVLGRRVASAGRGAAAAPRHRGAPGTLPRSSGRARGASPAHACPSA